MDKQHADNLSHLVPPISIPGEQLRTLLKGPESDYVHISAEFGGAVMGYLDIFHQLHCLLSFGWLLNVFSGELSANL